MLTTGALPGLNKRDMIRPKLDKPRGVLNQRGEGPVANHGRYWPSADLAPFVEHYWTVEWDVAEPQLVETLPHPSVHLVLEHDQAQLAGLTTQRFTRVLEGRGRVFSVKFLPGGFKPFLKEPVSSLSDRVVPLTAVFGASAADLAQQVLAQREHQAAIGLLEDFLRGQQPQPDPQAELAGRIVARIAAERRITRVEQVAESFGLNLRRLQRLFNDYVGVGPKWVIQRYRLHEAAERLAAEPQVDCAGLALELGYADQAHFIRDFKQLVGRSPAEYARGLNGG
jgi:AraC-like DNA-binding protein